MRVQRHLKALAAGEEKVRFNRLIWATWRVMEEARCFKRRGAMVTKAAEGNIHMQLQLKNVSQFYDYKTIFLGWDLDDVMLMSENNFQSLFERNQSMHAFTCLPITFSFYLFNICLV